MTTTKMLLEGKDFDRFIEEVFRINPNGKVYYGDDFYSFLVLFFANIVYSVDFELLEGNNDCRNVKGGTSPEVSSDSQLFFIDAVKNSSTQITFLTSGTTGAPKKVTHSVKWLVENTRVGKKYSANRWAFTYNPTHIAGIQVIFQAVLNANPILFCYKKNRDEIFKDMLACNVTNISGTPTFYKLLQPFNKILESVSRITIGGERSSLALLVGLQQVFPNAKVNNVYATTEFGSLLVSDGINFRIPANKKGKVRVYKNRLQVLSSLKSDKREWMDTGDVVEIISIEPLIFKFSARNTNFVNIGGERVNLEEVEEIASSLDYIKICKVYVRKSRVMDFLAMDVVLSAKMSKTPFQIRQELTENGLLNGRCPQIINIVESLEITRTGKIVR